MKVTSPRENLFFKAELRRQREWQNNPSTGKKNLVESTKDEFIKSYDNAIERLQRQKELSIALDSFMYNDKEITAILKQLPQQDRLEIEANFEEEMFTDPPPIGEPILAYYPYSLDEDSDEYLDFDHGYLHEFEPQKKDGSIDKKGIINWLNQIAAYLNK